MDDTDILDQYFFKGGEINEKGQEFLDNLKINVIAKFIAN